MSGDWLLGDWSLAGLAVSAAVAAAVVSTVGTGLVLRAVRRRGILDHPNERSSHERPTPKSGGVGAVAAVVVTLPVAAVLAGRVDLVWALVPVLGACAVGLLDDLRELRTRPKLGLLLAVAASGLLVGRADLIDLPFLDPFHLGAASVPLTLFWLGFFPHAFNFMDGIDGIAGITAFVSGGVFAVAGVAAGDPDTALLGGVTAGAAVGFLPWNFPRARIFMGDAGSLPLGLLLGLTALTAGVPSGPEEAPSVHFPAAVLLLGPFVFDVGFTLVNRARRGERFGEAHREHLYQRLGRAWGAHAPVSLLYGGLSVGMGCAAVAYGDLDDPNRLLSLTLPLGAMLGFAVFVLRFHRRADRDPQESQ